MTWTTDGFLDGRLQIRQPATGFRAGSDAVLLAAAVGVRPGQSVLDVGSGVGTAGLCLKYRRPDCVLVGLELQNELLTAAEDNAASSGLQKETQFHLVNIAKRSDFGALEAPDGRDFLEFGFDHVMTNPPFYQQGRAQASPNAVRTAAHIEGDADLADWIRFCAARLKPKGSFTLIHRTDRLAEILALVAEKCGGIRVLPLWPAADVPAKRVIVQAIKGDKGPLQLLPGLVMHDAAGAPTEMAEKILRNAMPISDLVK